MGKIAFDIGALAEQFKSFAIWMLYEGEYADKIRDDIIRCIENKKSICKNPDFLDALKEILELLITKSHHVPVPIYFDDQWQKFVRQHGKDFRTQEATKELFSIARFDSKNQMKKLFEYSSLKHFTEELHNLACNNKTMVLGEKGRDLYLRDFRYWDRIPIDMHEKNFIIRTGIYHACSNNNKRDPFDYMTLHSSLISFCKSYLGTYELDIEGNKINLGNEPGIVDVFIWRYCADEKNGGYSICNRNAPKCEQCQLNKTCLYALTQKI